MNGKRGRPKRDEVLETYYSIVAEIKIDEAMITKIRDMLSVDSGF